MSHPIIQIGWSAPETVAALLRQHSGLSRVYFTAYRPRPPVEQRLAADPQTRELLERLRQSVLGVCDGLPWEEFAVAAVLSASDLEVALREAGAHTVAGEGETTSLEASQITASRLWDLSRSAGEDGRVLGLCSRCVLDSGALAHIPMMDFRCRILGANAERIRRAVAHIAGGPGILLESGRSYHWYGCELLAPEQWVTFMGTCLLYSPLVDTRYIAHRLRERNGVLRISAGGLKPKVPTVLAFTESGHGRA